jgi:hypothetical protein
MPEPDPTPPFSSSLPIMTWVSSRRRPDDRPWNDAVRHACKHPRRIVCGPTGPDRDALTAEYLKTQKLAGVPPGSIVRLV